MKTIAVTVSVGSRGHLSGVSFPRLARWAARHGYDAALITEPLVQPGLHPHFNKLFVPVAKPGYERYVICDDDLLLSSHAPALPEIPRGHVGLAPDAVQQHTHDPLVEWTGNTGFIVADDTAAHLLSAAVNVGETPRIWGFADQGRVNHVLWNAGRIHRLDQRWNHQPVVHHFTVRDAWDRWQRSRGYRASFYTSLLLGWPQEPRRLLRTAYGVHLTRAPYPKFYDRLVP